MARSRAYAHSLQVHKAIPLAHSPQRIEARCTHGEARAKLDGQGSNRYFLAALPANADHLCLAIN